MKRIPGYAPIALTVVLLLAGANNAIGVSESNRADQPDSHAPPLLISRVLPTKPDRTVVDENFLGDALYLKLRDDSSVVLASNTFESLDSEKHDGVATVRQLLSGTTIRPVVDEPVEKIKAERETAMRNLGREIADISMWYEVRFVSNDRENVAHVIDQLNLLPLVELAIPKPAPIHTPPPPACPACENAPHLYSYFGSNGVNADAAWSAYGRTGQGVKVTDIEGGVSLNAVGLPSNSDLPQIHFLNNNPQTDGSHGLQMLGVMGALSNGSGVRGIAHGASYKFAAHYGNHDNICPYLTLARNAMSPGDVILLEIQAHYPGVPPLTGIPVERHPTSYDCIVHTVGLNYVVVETAGNAGMNLSNVSLAHHPFVPANDSGAIIVGAGEYNTQARRSTSVYGGRVNVQGWGNNVATTAPNNTFVNTGGTSSAGAMVAGVVALVQSIYKYNKGTYATPAAMRGALILTGNPQTGSTNPYWIGPLPDAYAAAQMLLDSGSAPKNFSVNSHYCYGMGDAQWSAPGSGSYSYVLEHVGQYGNTTTLYVGTNLSTFYNVPESGNIRVRACNVNGCGAFSAPQWQIRYGWCQ